MTDAHTVVRDAAARWQAQHPDFLASLWYDATHAQPYQAHIQLARDPGRRVVCVADAGFAEAWAGACAEYERQAEREAAAALAAWNRRARDYVAAWAAPAEAVGGAHGKHEILVRRRPTCAVVLRLSAASARDALAMLGQLDLHRPDDESPTCAVVLAIKVEAN